MCESFPFFLHGLFFKIGTYTSIRLIKLPLTIQEDGLWHPSSCSFLSYALPPDVMSVLWYDRERNSRMPSSLRDGSYQHIVFWMVVSKRSCKVHFVQKLGSKFVLSNLGYPNPRMVYCRKFQKVIDDLYT